MPLISAQELRALPEPLIIDVRWSLAHGADKAAYNTGHLPGAVFIDLSQQMCGPAGTNGRHPLPQPRQLRDALRSIGVTTESDIVIYDGGDGLAAARTWWTLRWAGLKHVRVLNGGYPAWIAANGEVTTQIPHPDTTDLEITPGQLPVLNEQQAAERAKNKTLLDVRAPERYRGDNEPMDPVAGHIPEAVNLPASETMAANGFASRDALRDLFADYGDDVGVYCGSGITAARTALAMTAAGHATPGVYIGSWSHWVTDASRPVATGDE